MKVLFFEIRQVLFHNVHAWRFLRDLILRIGLSLHQVATPVDPQFFPMHAQRLQNLASKECFLFTIIPFLNASPQATQIYSKEGNQTTSICIVVYNINKEAPSVWMLSSFSKYLPQNKYYTVTFNRILNLLSILVVDEQNDSILACSLTPQDCPSTLLQIFNGKMEILYAYLSRDDSQIDISESDEEISIRYSLTVLKKTVQKSIKMHTKKYLLAKDSAFSPTKSQSEQKINFPDSLDHAEYWQNKGQLWKQLLRRCNDERTMSKIHCLKAPYWLANDQAQLLLQIGDKIPLIENEQGRLRYQLSIQLNQFHEDASPRYDLTLGLAHPSRMAKIKEKYKRNHDDQISLSIVGRIVSSRCLRLTEKKTQEKVVSVNRLRIELIEVQQQGKKRLESISFIMDEKLINLLGKQALAPMQELLQKLDQFIPFVQFYRSFLHFSFELEQLYNV